MLRSIGLFMVLGASVMGFAACGGTVVSGGGCDPEEQCPEGLYPVSSCGDAYECITITACGETILCGSAPCYDGCCGGGDFGDCCDDSTPSCPPEDVQVSGCPLDASCYTLDFCDGQIMCQTGGGCLGDPACDPGDFTAGTTCPPDAICYELQACGGVTLQCIDTVLPAHGCPFSPPIGSTSCDTPDLFCDYPTSESCFDSYACMPNGDTQTWEWIGGGCEGSN